VDDDGPVGKGASLALNASGLPHVAYMYVPVSGSGYYLKYAYSDGTAWHVEAVDNDGDTGRYPSLALDSFGHPHVSYQDMRDAAYQTTEDLNYSSYDGASWTIETVDSEGNSGGSSSLVIDSQDRPHIAYSGGLESGQKHLKYAWNDGSVWNIETADSQDNVGDECSLALDSLERPHISYLDGTNNNVKYAYFDGAVWQSETSDAEVGTGYGNIDLSLDSLDLPRVSYGIGRVGVRDTKYSYYDGSAWHSEALNFGGRWMHYPSLALDSHDRPHIAHNSSDPYEVMYTYWDDDEWRTQTIENSSGQDSSLALNSLNRPCVCYYVEGAVNNELKYAAYY
jgi:hypothetical protein